MFVSSEVEKRYRERLARYVTAMRGGTPDRIPIRFMYQEVAARYCGHTTQQVACLPQLAFEDTRKMAEDMGNDAVMLNAIWSNYGVGKAASWRYLNVPGVDVGMESVLQYSEPSRDEDALMHEHEYGEFSQDPTAFLYGKWIARYTHRLVPPGSPLTLEHNMALASGALAYANYMQTFGPAAHALKYQSGLVSANSGMVKAPLDILMDKLRGYMNVAVETLTRPRDVEKACRALMPHMVANALAGADPEGQVPVTLWAHRGCLPFITRDTFDTIAWPTLRPVLEEIIHAGHQVLFYSEGDWEAHYDDLLELPAGGIIYHLDKGDPKLAAQKLGGRFPLSGGVRYDILARGTPGDVRRHLSELLPVMASGGAYILDATALMLNDIRPENVRAAVEYVMEHGVYSQGHAGAPLVPQSPRMNMQEGTRPPNTVIPWAQESAPYRKLGGDVELVKQSWQAVDASAYNYIWTTLLW